MSIRKVIGKNIVSLRKQKRMTQEYLALYSDLSVTHVRDIEHGVANPTILSLTRLANTLEVSVTDLLAQDLHRKHMQNGACDQITRPPPLNRGGRFLRRKTETRFHFTKNYIALFEIRISPRPQSQSPEFSACGSFPTPF